MRTAFLTDYGGACIGDSIEFLESLGDDSINLVFTSPPFSLQRKKDYGNASQREYIEWFSRFAGLVYRKLRPDGSFVVDVGGAYEKGVPVRSLYNFRLAVHLCDQLRFFLAQDFYWFNPSKLPSPIEWVNKRKIRAKDAVNNVWWFSKTEWPKSDVSKVRVEYSARMRRLLEDPEGFYKPAKRPSGHDIGTAFARDNGGAIPSNLLQIPNTESNGQYLSGCKAVGVEPHPARFPAKLPQFFIRFLTGPGDFVVDIFGGSCTTGQVAEAEERRWLTCDIVPEYVAAGMFRFFAEFDEERARACYAEVMNGSTVDLGEMARARQKALFHLSP